MRAILSSSFTSAAVGVPDPDPAPAPDPAPVPVPVPGEVSFSGALTYSPLVLGASPNRTSLIGVSSENLLSLVFLKVLLSLPDVLILLST